MTKPNQHHGFYPSAYGWRGIVNVMIMQWHLACLLQIYFCNILELAQILSDLKVK